MIKRNNINAVAPIRICDIGGWTDTWFAHTGAVFNIAVYPYVEVQIQLAPRTSSQRITIAAENFNQTYSIDPQHDTYQKHPLIEAAIGYMQLPDDMELHINIFSDAPPGASTGTSAALSVALIGALDALTEGRYTPHEVAALAHHIESKILGLESGIQDQLASAYGGINYIQMHQYPQAAVSSIQVPNGVWWELEHRLSVIYIGSPHSSSEIHKKVIERLGNEPHKDDRLLSLQELAREAKDALFEGDFKQLGHIMRRNTQIQRDLHPALICEKFDQIIQVAKDYDVLGYKVNGAGGDGGSMTLLSSHDMSRKRAMIRELAKLGFSQLPIYLSRQGLRVW